MIPITIKISRVAYEELRTAAENNHESIEAYITELVESAAQNRVYQAACDRNESGKGRLK